MIIIHSQNDQMRERYLARSNNAMWYGKIVSVALGAGLFFGGQAVAQTVQPSVFGQHVRPPGSSVVVPHSSLAKPEDQGVAAHTNTRFITPKSLGPQTGSSPLVGPPYTGYGYETPGSLSCLYGLVAATAECNPNTAKTVSTKGSRAIAIVDAYNYPTAVQDLQKFSTQFGLPAPNLKVVHATAAGACNGPTPTNDPAGWEGEEALDVQMAHAMAPHAALYLVEAQSNSNGDLLGAVKCANTLLTAAGGGELSMSWGGSEFSGETSFDTYFSTPNVVYFAASGDSPGVSWPSTSAKVVSVGGTSISRALPSFNFEHYSAWSEGGGGVSNFVARPTYQNSISAIVGARRGAPDISAVANPDTGVWVYDSNSYHGVGWYIFGGTSVASPLMAGIVNAMGTFRANTAVELTAIYAAKAANPTLNFAIPTLGYCGPYASYAVVPAWNFCVGVGTVKEPATPLALQ
jgi:kumamolisin